MENNNQTNQTDQTNFKNIDINKTNFYKQNFLFSQQS
jgi:hypothetical protein